MSTLTLPADRAVDMVAALFTTCGLAPDDARLVADSLVCADLEGVASHGLMLVPLYLDRLRAGSVSADAVPRVVEDHGGLLVMSAEHALGQVSSRAAVEVAVERARAHGVSVVAVCHAFHFGAAAYWSRRFADVGMVGFAFSNTRPLMPAPGGAERVVGNNPLSIAFPADPARPVVVDMAMSATSMGRVRLADAAGIPIPLGWATDAQGQPTQSAAAAIAGMLLPAAGPKGFGLAFAIDLLCGALSGGAIGAEVSPLYGDAAVPYDCSHAFIAIDASRLHAGSGIAGRVEQFAQGVRGSRPADPAVPVLAPGDLERGRRAQAHGRCTLPAELVARLDDEARRAGLSQRLADIP